MAKIIYDVIEDHVVELKNEQIRTYGMAKFFFTYLLGEIMKTDSLGAAIINNPKEYVVNRLVILRSSVERLWKLLISDINAYIEEYTEQNNKVFDYKNIFKNAEFVKNSVRRIKTDHQRIIVRHPEDSFKNIVESIQAKLNGDTRLAST